jgi:beta-lactam-binding protein with PASTA domain
MTSKIAAAVTAAAFALAACGGIGDAPDVRGIALDDANAKLKAAGYSSTIVEDDALFGVVIESGFEVCDQDAPEGKLVPLHVAKRGC